MTIPALRIGQIVPSSNTTMETEIPAILRARGTLLAERFTIHSSRMRMKKVVKEELEAMDRESERCVLELPDARVMEFTAMAQDTKAGCAAEMCIDAHWPNLYFLRPSHSR